MRTGTIHDSGVMTIEDYGNHCVYADVDYTIDGTYCSDDGDWNNPPDYSDDYEITIEGYSITSAYDENGEEIEYEFSKDEEKEFLDYAEEFIRENHEFDCDAFD